MAPHGESNRRPAPPRSASAGLIAPAIALVLAAASAAGALYLSQAGRESLLETAIQDLTTSGENCSLESDAASRAASKAARTQSQLEGFIRERFHQLHDRAAAVGQQQRLAAIQAAQAQTQAAAKPVPRESDEMIQLRSRLATLIGHRAGLLDRVTPEHPQIIELSHQIDALDVQLAALSRVSAPPPPAETAPQAIEIPAVPADAVLSDAVPAVAMEALAKQSAADYEHLAEACRRAQRQLDEAQAGHCVALDHHLGQIGRIEMAVAAWDRLSTAATTVSQVLWAVAGFALLFVAWTAVRGAAGKSRSRDEQVLTDASQIERWFSLPVVSVAAR